MSKAIIFKTILLSFFLFNNAVYPYMYKKENKLAGSYISTRDNYKRYKDIKDASEFGVKYNVQQNQSEQLQKAVNACSLSKSVLKISGEIFIDKSVTVPSDAYIYSDNGGGICFTGDSPWQDRRSDLVAYVMQVIPGSKDINIRGLTIRRQNVNYKASMYSFISCIKSSDIVVDGCKIYMNIISANIPQLYTDEDGYSKTANITVKNCIAYGDRGSRRGVIEIRYANNIRIENNTIDNFDHGVIWWGGDSNGEVDGKITNERKLKNIIITNNIVTNADAGIWGSMGQDILIEGNKVEKCDDVGIDFEGCFNGIADSNIVKNSKNGNLTTFFLNKNITFSNNIAISEYGHGVLISKIYNQTQSPDNDNVKYTGNTFKYESDKGYGYFTIESCNLTNVENNVFINTLINTGGVNIGDLSIKNNSFELLNATDEKQYCIKIKGMAVAGSKKTNSRLCIIENNIINKNYNSNFGSTGIYTEGIDYNSDSVFKISNNAFTGYNANDTAIEVYGNSANPKVTTRFFINSNFIDNGSILRTDTQMYNSQVIMADNKMFDYTPYPYELPNSGKWDKGQIIELAMPKGKTTGYKCIKSGVCGVNEPVWISLK